LGDRPDASEETVDEALIFLAEESRGEDLILLGQRFELVLFCFGEGEEIAELVPRPVARLGCLVEFRLLFQRD